MNAKTYCKKTAAFAGFIIQNIPADLDEGTMDGWMNNPEGTKKFLSGLKPAKKLLEFVKTFRLPTVSNFIAAEKFRLGKTVDGIKVGWLGDNFKSHFLKKTEEQASAIEIHEHKLLKGSQDSAIIVELGGEEKIHISLGHYWELLKAVDQKFWYVAYIKDTKNVLWNVRAGWNDAGLCCQAVSLGWQLGPFAGDRLLSC